MNHALSQNRERVKNNTESRRLCGQCSNLPEIKSGRRFARVHLSGPEKPELLKLSRAPGLDTGR